MIPSTLDVERHQIVSEPVRRVVGEEASTELLGEEPIKRLRHLLSESLDQRVHASRQT